MKKYILLSALKKLVEADFKSVKTKFLKRDIKETEVKKYLDLFKELARKYQVRASEWRGYNKAKVDIKESTNPTHGMKELTADKTSKLTYSENPIINYTSRGLNPEDYIYIEWMETDRDNRGEGYGTLLVEYLINKYPDKTILASANDKSAGLLKKLGVTLI